MSLLPLAIGADDAFQATQVAIVASSLVFSVVYTRRTLARADARHRELLDRDRDWRRTDAAKARQASLEDRLDRVVTRAAEYEELRWSAMKFGDAARDAMLGVPAARRRLQTAIIQTGLGGEALLRTRALLDANAPGQIPPQEAFDAAFAELEAIVVRYSSAALVPFDNE